MFKTAVLTMLLSCALLASAVSPASAGTIVFSVAVNTDALFGNAGAPFALEFQLTDGGPGSGTTTATVSDFVFTNAALISGPTGAPVRTPAATGDLSTAVSLADTEFFSDFYQPFTLTGATGSSIRFLVTLSNSLLAPASGTPDSFGFAILDNGILNIPTTDAIPPIPGAWQMLRVDIDKPVLGGSDLQAFVSTSPAGVTLTATPVPEPTSMLLLATGLVGVGVRRWSTRRSSARRS
jgi:hypothetical protein